ncbi:SCY1-like protein 2 [Echinococcus granulosus]|uniref:Scy1 protein 2 n=1 Tax=Echinococcus granulosus TaxID=6210 RepID=A0A068WW10_ECHGR|nr:SCY1-like protein 2 [Echinococcus granulosus]CDS22687.1 scy1 protein 2 [Echinococcus granulosus]
MDSVINRLRNTVSSALPGNQVSREFDLEEQVGSSGPGLLWKLYSATKRSSKEAATVWIFEKKALERFSKREREMILEKLKQGVAALTRFRHPRILSVVHPLEESRESLGFATESLFTSLSNALGKVTNLSRPVIEKLNNFKFTETELKYGIIQICEALTFIHREGHRFHLNVSPESIVVNRLGSWKLCGFEFACEGNDGEGVDIPSWQSSVPSLCQPHLDFCAPEVVIEGRGYAASDMFSIGVLIHAIYNDGVSLINCHESYGAYREAVKKLKPLSPHILANIPPSIRDYVKMLLQPDIDIRPDAHEILKSPFLDDANVTCLRSLDDLYQMDNLARSKFYRNLPNSIKSLPPEFPNKSMIPFVLPSILQIIDIVSREEVATYIMPRFKHVLAVHEPIQVVQVLLQNLGILVAKLSLSDFKTYALPVLNSALDSDVTPTLELCLQGLPEVAQLMDFSVLKSNIVPRLKKVYFRVDLVNMRLEVLVCMAKLLEYLDRWSVMDDILTFLTEIRSRESKILVAVLAIYQIAFSHKKLGISRDFLASKSIPHLLQLSMDCNLTPLQHAAFADLVREMFTAIETEQRAKLIEMHSLGEDAAAFVSPSLKLDGTASEMVSSIMLSLTGVSTSPTRMIPTAEGGAKNPATEEPNAPGTLALQPQQAHLSLGAKKRAADLEQLERLKQQPSLLTPKAAPPPRPEPTSTNLSDLLINSNLSLDWNRTANQSAFPPMVQNSTAPFGGLGGSIKSPQQPDYPYPDSTNTSFNGGNMFFRQGNNQLQLPPTSTMYGRPMAPSAFSQPVQSTQSSKTPILSNSDIMDLLG